MGFPRIVCHAQIEIPVQLHRIASLGARPKADLSVLSVCEGARSNKFGRATQDIAWYREHAYAR